ncbi:hypothetical protein Aglo03_57700 [Actinokineospora globicatena]|uniref:Uncharacterized protein n=1 Tax=Actinokineospora globicatena TaxID=103729 RepID=A0A9W6VCH0_9PSEU|nr:hypothetical protein Aglo03_57700 [Actinokineospora globicatena]
MTSPHKTPQTMKPATAAKKLGVYLEATPAEFQDGLITRDELNALQADPPGWLRDLRRDGPHPRTVVAAKLRVSIGGLTRAGFADPLTTEQIEAIKAENPEWLQQERTTQAEFRKESERVKTQAAADKQPKPAPKPPRTDKAGNIRKPASRRSR